MSDKKKPQKPISEAPPALAWLEALEARVHDAVARLTEAAAENANLRQRIADLEARLAKAVSAGPATSDQAGATDPGPAAWHQEREEIRTRIHRLTQTLAGLLEDPE